MKKQLTALLLCIVIAFSFCGCSPILTFVSLLGASENTALKVSDGNEVIDVEPQKPSVSEYEPITVKNAYNTLSSDDQKSLYEKFYDCVYLISSQKEEDGCYVSERITFENVSLDDSQLVVTYSAFLEDNPQFFWLLSSFSYLIDGNTVYFRMNSEYSGEEIKKMNERFVEKTNEFLDSIPKEMSAVSRELYVYDYLIDSVEYDDDAALEMKDVKNYKPYTSFGAIVDSLAVCEGYSRAFQYYLSLVGVNCANIYGYGEKEPHLWSAVELDNEWYYCDVTWGDSEENIVRYDYFNVTDNVMKEDHTLDKLFTELSEKDLTGEGAEAAQNFNFFIPACTSTKYNYYSLYGTYYDYSEEKYFDELCAGLYEAALDKKDYLHIKICTDSVSFSDTVTYLFKEEPYKFFDAVDEVNGELSGFSIDSQKASILERESMNIVSVVLSYE